MRSRPAGIGPLRSRRHGKFVPEFHASKHTFELRLLVRAPFPYAIRARYCLSMLFVTGGDFAGIARRLPRWWTLLTDAASNASPRLHERSERRSRWNFGLRRVNLQESMEERVSDLGKLLRIRLNRKLFDLITYGLIREARHESHLFEID